MSETLQALFGFALIVGLFVWYFREQRAKRRPTVAPPSPEPSGPIVDEQASDAVSYGSPNWGAPLLYVFLLAAIRTTQRSWWSVVWLGVYFAIWAVGAYSTFSPKELAAEQARRPGTRARFHYIRLGIPYVFFPFLGWLVSVRFGWAPGILVPVLPWIFLIAAIPFVAVRRA